MTTVENALLKQMQKLAATMSGVPAAGRNQGGQSGVSFQEMLQKSGNRTEKPGDDKDTQDKPLEDAREAVEEAGNPELPVKDKEELKAENLTGNPNAVGVLDLFRPEIVENVEQAEPVLTPIPEETVEGAALDLGEQAPEMEASVDAGIGAEVSMEQQPRDFRQSMEEAAPQPQTAPEEAPVQQAAPERQAEQTQEPERTEEVHAELDEEPAAEEAPAAERPVFRETQSVPVKVGERFETVDTRQPELDNQMADVIRTAVQTGQERIEIRLTPQNLGNLVIEMTRDTNGVLQVVLHAATPRAESLLNQHMNGLHTALQAYGHEEVHVEVQRGEESQQQNFRQADPDGRGQQQHGRGQQERREEQHSGEEFMQKLRLGLFGTEE